MLLFRVPTLSARRRDPGCPLPFQPALAFSKMLGGNVNKQDDMTLYILGDYDFVTFAPGMRVVDIGCGNGRQLQQLRERGCRAIGLELSYERLRGCAERGLQVVAAQAEQLPLAGATFDGVICKAVIPLTVESIALREIARILKPDGIARFCYQGAGFYLRLLILGSGGKLKQRVYGLRTLINTWLFALTGWVLPGYWGDTLYQSRCRLHEYYSENRLTLIRESPSKTFLRLPVFIYHVVQAGPQVCPQHLAQPATGPMVETLSRIAS